MKKILKILFSLENNNTDKVLTILGIKFVFKNSRWFYKRAHKDRLSRHISEYIDKFQDEIYEKYGHQSFTAESFLKENFNSPDYLFVDSLQNYLYILLNTNKWIFNKKANINTKDDFMLCWEIRPHERNYKIIKFAKEHNKKLIFAGDSFLRSISTAADKKENDFYKMGISFTFDDLTSYFDATRPSRLEQMLNDPNLIITKEQKQRARRCIDKIIANHLTKYNHQPIYTPEIGRKGVKKVLVVDQSYGDMSILKGMGNDETFKNMLESAIRENPEADIIVKTHPDTIAGMGGYYTGLKQKGNIYPITFPINPISLIQYCDKVYVCTTQFGFEALMCNKEVHVFGMPFYAGWGLTIDAQKCERRTIMRSLEEVFYIAYIMYSYYVNPEKKCRCEIEEAMDYLLKKREEYEKSKEKNFGIPIVFALDDGYAMPTAVAITSLLENKNKETFYKIYLLTPGLSENHYKKLKSFDGKGCSINIIENKDALKNFHANLEKVTSTDYFRLILPSFIKEEKVIALDGDLLVLDDLNELYNIDLEENIIGGCYFRPHDVYNREYVQNTLGLDEGKRINIGVMLMDLKKIKENALDKEFVKHIGRFKVMSEDIINYVCKNKIKYLPLKYNYNLHFYKYKKLLKNCPKHSEKEYKEAEKHPTVFHYTLEKPWKVKNVVKNKLWLKYYKKSPYENEKINYDKPKEFNINFFGIRIRHRFKE